MLPPLGRAIAWLPVRNIYLRKVGKNAKGENTNLTVRTIGSNVAADNVSECKD